MFDAIVLSNGWGGATAVLQLLSHLQDDALSVALLLPMPLRASRKELTDALYITTKVLYRAEITNTGTNPTQLVGCHSATRCPTLDVTFPFILPGWKAEKTPTGYLMISPKMAMDHRRAENED